MILTRLTQQLCFLAALLLLATPAALLAAPEPAPEPASGQVPLLETVSATAAAVDLQGAGVIGRVLTDLEPLSAVRVYAYQLADFSMKRVVTDEAGAFRFADLPAGLYKIIAHKSGFVPAVVMLTRARDDSLQFLELELAEQSEETAAGEDFWSVRGRIPADVLRDLEAPEPDLRLAATPFSSNRGAERWASTRGDRFATEMEAMTGIDYLPAVGEAVLTGGQVGFEGAMGGYRVGLSGDYWRLAPGGGTQGGEDVDGLARHLTLEVEGDDSELLVSTLFQRLAGSGEEPIDFQTHRLSWDKEFDSSRAHLATQHTSQVNYYADASIAPVEAPRDSKAWELEGSYTLEATERASFQGGLRYRDRSVGVLSASGREAELSADPDALRDERLDLFGRAGTRVRPTVLIEYGLYTTLRDGSLSMTPHGGVVVQLGDSWQASAVASGKVSHEDALRKRDFVPAFYSESSACTQGEQSCYKISLSRDDDHGDSALSVGAIHREIGETLRLFFDDDFFNHVESLYLVEGDQLPEVQFGVSRRVTPQILARLESNVGQGGGGIFYGTDDERYENSVRFLVTSLDTQFQGTDTGLFISFHHLEQELDPLNGGLLADADRDGSRLELQRLQLMLTQDLGILFDLAADWALKLNMEFSRGSVLFGSPNDSDELRRRILGGLAVRF